MSNPDQGSASIRFNGVRKVYNDKIIAVDEFSASIKDGEFITIVGPSGSGKSTLLRMIAGLEDISGGDIHIGENSIRGVEPQKRGIAMVFQNYALYPHMSVEDNMGYGLKLTTDLSADEIQDRVRETAAMMGIEDQLQSLPGNLSGGQQQRVATGRAIVRDPKVFLMDEPLSNLDAKLKVHMRTELQRLQEDLGTTTIYVTHDQHEALTMSDRIIILDEGKLQQFGTPEEIYEQPANRFVADFVGSPAMNFFDVTAEGSTLVSPGFEYEIPETIQERIQSTDGGPEFELGIRPEDIRFTEANDTTIPAVVDVVENAGSDTYLYLDVSGTACTVRAPSGTPHSVKDRVHISFSPEQIHLFDKAMGNSVLHPEDSRRLEPSEATA